MYTVGQFARILSVSAKTLRHYDAIGLFSPAQVGPDNGYRYYGRDQIAPLRRILFLKDLGLPLEVVRELIRSGAVNDPARVEAILREQAVAIRQAMAHQEALLSRLETTIAQLGREGEVPEMETQPVVVKEVPAVTVVGVRRTISIGEISELFREAGAKVRGPVAGPPLALYHNPEFDPEVVDVEVLFPVSAGAEKSLPETRVAAITHVGRYDAVGGAYAALFAWVNEQGHRLVGPPREVYLVGPESGKAPEEYVTEVQMPIG